MLLSLTRMWIRGKKFTGQNKYYSVIFLVYSITYLCFYFVITTMAFSHFDELTETDIDQLLESDQFPVESREAAEIDVPQETTRRVRNLRPRTVEPIAQYVAEGNHRVADSITILRNTVETYGNESSEPDEPKRQIGSFLKLADNSEDIPIEQWNTTKFSLKMDEEFMDELMDLARFNFIDRCVEVLENNRTSYKRAPSLPEYSDQISSSKWEDLVTEECHKPSEYPYVKKDFTAFNSRVDDRTMANSFLDYHLTINNLKKTDTGYMVKGSPEEVRISRKALEYLEERQSKKLVQYND